MNRDDLKDHLKRPTRRLERQLDCPDDYDLASYMEGGLNEKAHKRFESHLADCGFCMERVGLLGRARDTEAESPVPDLLLARSAKLAKDQDGSKAGYRIPNLRLNYARRWAAAAVVVLAIGLLMNLESPKQVTQESTPPGGSLSPIRQERNIDPYALVPKIISPAENSTINPRSQQFVWAPVRGSLYYQIRIVSDEGDLVWQERVNGTQWALPPQVLLIHDSEYFVRVDAYLAESKSLNSDYVVFKVTDKR